MKDTILKLDILWPVKSLNKYKLNVVLKAV